MKMKKEREIRKMSNFGNGNRLTVTKPVSSKGNVKGHAKKNDGRRTSTHFVRWDEGRKI